MVRKLRPRSNRRSMPLLRFRDLSRSSSRRLGLLDLKDVLLVGPSIGWLSVASKRVTVVTRVRTGSQLALPVARGELDNFVIWAADRQMAGPKGRVRSPRFRHLLRTDLTVNDKRHSSSRDARRSRSEMPDSASAHPMLHSTERESHHEPVKRLKRIPNDFITSSAKQSDRSYGVRYVVQQARLRSGGVLLVNRLYPAQCAH